MVADITASTNSPDTLTWTPLSERPHDPGPAPPEPEPGTTRPAGVTPVTTVAALATETAFAEPAPTTGVPPTEGRSVSVPRQARDERKRTNRRLVVAIVVVLALLLAAVGLGRCPAHQPALGPAGGAGQQSRGTDRGRLQPVPTPGRPRGRGHSIPALDYAQQSALEETPVPIASLTKMTNALVVLRDHPVPAGPADRTSP